MSNKLFIALACLLGFCTIADGQNSPNLKTVVAPSPNASALGKYGEIPVGLYTGIANISVPIYTVKGRELEVPISLNYHAGGIRVEEIASWVGIGWSLNAGGVITRTIRGGPDDRGGFFDNYVNTTAFAQKYYLNQSAANSIEINDGNVAPGDISTVNAYISNTIDGEPDIYYFNFGKYSGSFFMNQSGQIVVSSLQALKVQYSFDASGAFSQWILTTPDGVKYIFGTSADGTRTALESNSNGAPWPVATTGWYLEDICSPHADTVSFNYTPISYSYNSRSSEVLNVPITGADGAFPYRDLKIGLNNMIVPRLTTITSANGTVSFGAGVARIDLPGEAALGNINIYNKVNAGTLLENWQFFYSNGTRLTLDSLQQYSADGTLVGQGYQFSYNSTPLPNPDPNQLAINSQDLWGYYNGVSNTVFPQGYSTATQYSTGVTTITGADRHSDSNMMQAGVLTQITYPTGGYSKFDYQANTIYQSAEDLSVPTAGVGKDALVIFSPAKTVSDTFTITYPDPNTHVAQLTGVIHTMEEDSCTYDPSGYSQCYTASLYGIDGTSYGPIYFKEGPISATLPVGTYVIEGQGTGNLRDSGNIIHFELDWTEYPPPPTQGNPNEMVNKPIGGLRILRITDFDGTSTSVTKYLYNQFNNDTASSAVLVNDPYTYVNTFESAQLAGDDGNTTTVNEYLQVKAYPLIPLMPTQGAPVGYQNVTKLLGENGENGKEEYTYTTANDYPDEVQHQRPYAMSCSYDNRRGQLLRTTTYSNNGGIFTPVRAKASAYFVGAKQTVSYGVMAQCDAVGSAIGHTVQLGGNDYYASGYRTISEFLYPQTDTVWDYQQNYPSFYMQTITHYAYDTTNGHYQLIKSQTTDSKNHVVEKDYQYPPDLTLSGYEETARDSLLSQYILTPVLDEKTYRNGVQTYDVKNNYQVFGNHYPLPQSIDEQVSTNSLDRRVVFLRYDNRGNLTQQQKTNDVLYTYLWDYSQTYPIAQVVNADSVDIAYTSFEADGSGNWQVPSTARDTGSITGGACYNLTNGSIVKTGLTSGNTYIVSFWKKTGSASVTGSTGSVQGKTINGWTYYEYTVTGVTTETVSGAGDIDELRLYPASAQMTSYTYSPLVGMTSQCDVGSKITYYNYDKLNRLSVLKDQDGNIIKTYQYHYQEQ